MHHDGGLGGVQAEEDLITVDESCKGGEGGGEGGGGRRRDGGRKKEGRREGGK